MEKFFNNTDPSGASRRDQRGTNQETSRGWDYNGHRSRRRGGKEKMTRNELDELATILAPAQIKKFQDLNDGAIKKPFALSAKR
jgi:hypothetical protein